MNNAGLPILAFLSHCMSKHGSGFLSDPLKGVNIEFEYKLIQQKKSSLSARLRRIVVYRYENQKGGNQVYS